MKRKEKKNDETKKYGKLERKVLRSVFIIFIISVMTTMSVIFVMFYKDKVAETREKMTNDVYFFYASMIPPIEWDDDSEMSDEEFVEALDNMKTPSDYIENWLENGEDEYYHYAKKQLTEELEESDYDDVFVYRARKDEDGNITRDCDIILDAPSRDGSEYPLGYSFKSTNAFDTIKTVYDTKESAAYDSTATNDSGFILVAFAPIIDYGDNLLDDDSSTVCAVIGLEISVHKVIWWVFRDNYPILLNTLITYLFFWGLAFIFIRKRVVRPVNTISLHMNKFVSNEGSLEFEPITSVHTNDEMEQIADDFNSLAQSVIDYTKNLEQKTTEEERLKLDLDVANQIRSVVSSETTYPAFPERTDFDLCASLGHTMFNKCSFFNYFFTQTDHLFIVLGESLGNSLASMIFSILSVSYIKSYAKTGAPPCKIAFDTNNQLCSTEKKDSGMTVGAIIVDVDLSTGIMRYVNAGMPPILIKEPGENYAADKATQPFCLGQMLGIPFEQKTIRLSQGSTVLFTSFGITEMSNENGAKYGINRLVDKMNHISGNVYALNETVEKLEADIEKFRNDAPVSMDTAVVAFRYFG